MATIKISEDINFQRRRFFGTAATSIAAAQLILSGSAHAQPSKAKPAHLPNIKPGTNTSFGPLKQIDAGLFNRWKHNAHRQHHHRDAVQEAAQDDVEDGERDDQQERAQAE